MKELIIISGPCVIESYDVCLEVATIVNNICKKLGFKYVFKSSFKKANRTKVEGFAGINEEEAFKILRQIKSKLKIPVLTDVHETSDVDKVKDFADYIQVPAFLCKQTDLILAAGRSGKWVNLKKGQFVSPETMLFAAEKVRSTGNNKVMLTERGSTFGYNDWVVDFRSVPRMKKAGVPVIVDCTHPLQKTEPPRGGDPEMIETLCKAAVAVGADGLFIETHPHPAKAWSDEGSMLQLKEIGRILESCSRIRKVI